MSSLDPNRRGQRPGFVMRSDGEKGARDREIFYRNESSFDRPNQTIVLNRQGRVQVLKRDCHTSKPRQDGQISLHTSDSRPTFAYSAVCLPVSSRQRVDADVDDGGSLPVRGTRSREEAARRTSLAGARGRDRGVDRALAHRLGGGHGSLADARDETHVDIGANERKRWLRRRMASR